ncbi:hypothetical protein HAINFHK1212_0569, partial [Haemophilus influenzae HK1212]
MVEVNKSVKSLLRQPQLVLVLRKI